MDQDMEFHSKNNLIKSTENEDYSVTYENTYEDNKLKSKASIKVYEGETYRSYMFENIIYECD